MRRSSTIPEGGDSNCTTIMHNKKMPPGGDNGVTNSGKLNEMPPDGYLLAKEPGAEGGTYRQQVAVEGDWHLSAIPSVYMNIKLPACGAGWRRSAVDGYLPPKNDVRFSTLQPKKCCRI